MKKIVSVLALAASVMAAGSVAAQTLGPNVMRMGVRLTQNNFISSLNGNYHLIMQSDGNLVLYAMPPQGAQTTGFSSGQGGGGSYAVQQDDGNFVVYKANNTWQWTSLTGGRATKDYIMVLGDDGSLTIREPASGNFNVVRVFFQDQNIGGRFPMNFPARKLAAGSCTQITVQANTGAGAVSAAAAAGAVLGTCSPNYYQF